ncbi:hypothetical protein LGH82_08460 [Mesorhizobium sp. PAMC28654]|uniref:DUF7660 family protein n=1 Tax=Mesorhizobium sp. PAMC28654 TaxID=2880934 RepID=UPI001D0BAEB2|nr:hypothetical protein [Mesorhizobium sp. PAMC28654]UDL91275.1 hypothetical protein LGH82_08460 [Mesorhizobium sp. PAMC28654]
MANDKLWDEVRESAETSASQLDFLLDQVTDLRSFTRFIDALRKDWDDADRRQTAMPSGPGSGWNGWENDSISTFLESAVACVSDHLRLDPAFLANENSWKAAAKILYAGKYYE